MWSHAADSPTHLYCVLLNIATILLGLLFTFVPLLKHHVSHMQANSKSVDLLPVVFFRNDVTSGDVCADMQPWRTGSIAIGRIPTQFLNIFRAGTKSTAFHCYDSDLGSICNWLLCSQMPKTLPSGQCYSNNLLLLFLLPTFMDSDILSFHMVCLYRPQNSNQHFALICNTPLFYILVSTCFGSSLPSSGSFLEPSELLKIQIEWVVYHIVCCYMTSVPECRGSFCDPFDLYLK
jgi:hypothetical protein